MKLIETKYTNDYGNSTVIPYSPKWKRILFMVSGGLDSALLLYLTSKTFKENNLNIEIIPISYVLPTKPAADVKKIIKIIRNLTGYEYIKKCKIVEIPEKHCWAPHKNEFILNRNVEEIIKLNADALFTGDTKNPPEEIRSKWSNDHKRSTHRDNIESIYAGKTSIYPHANMNKQDIISLYKIHNLLENIAPLTLSCDETYEYINHHNTGIPCNSCWWCQERRWGFESNGISYEKYTK